MRPVHTFSVIPSLPPAIEGLREVAFNLRWCWSHESIELFRRLDQDLWEKAGHNPVLMLGTIEQAKLEAATADDAFVAHLHRVESNLKTYLSSEMTWFQRSHDQEAEIPLIAYFSGHRDEVTMLGSLPSATAGEWLEAEGWWVKDKEHGLQFKATLMKTIPPSAVEGIEPLTRTKANCLPSGENAGPESW
jgi:hypothetical protein